MITITTKKNISFKIILFTVALYESVDLSFGSFFNSKGSISKEQMVTVNFLLL